LERHHRRTHGPNACESPRFKVKKIYSCSFCQKECKSKFELKVHEAVHTGDKPLQCNICQASFALPSRLKQHSKTHKSYPCTHETCDFVAAKWTLLRKHLIDHKRRCKFCCKTFSSETALTNHESKHSQEFKCTQCQSSYSRKANLKTHIRTVHDKVLFKCSFNGCEQEFAHRKSLRSHFKVHDLSKELTSDVKDRPKIWRKSVAYAEVVSGFEAPDCVRIEILEEDKNFRRELISQDVQA
jgi:uncharacterized Zn-finger protein